MPTGAASEATGAATGAEERFRGELIDPGDPGYDAARAVWNGTVEHRPALIARVTGAQDVADALVIARGRGLPVAVRGGGHHVAGAAVAEGSLVIDLSGLRGVEVDAEQRIARAQGGAQLGDLDAATQALLLAVPAGVVSETGVAGLTLGGGVGWLRRAYGLTADNLVGAQVVTAEGRVLRVSESEHPDLLWGLRGGGMGLAVVTEFEFRAHPVGPELAFTFVLHPGERAAEALRLYRDYVREVPDQVSSIAVMGRVPAEEAFPAAIHGRPFVLFGSAYAGDPAEGERWARPLREFDTPLADFSGRLPYVEMQQVWDADYPTGGRYYWRSAYLDGLDDATIEAAIERTLAAPSPITTLDLWHLGGAIDHVATDATAYPHRGAAFLAGIEANWTDRADDAANIAWARDTAEAFGRLGARGSYANFEERSPEALARAHGPHHERLRELKARYDPGGVFADGAR